MTPTRYFIARITRAFGIHRKNQRMSDAAGEMHLLREAEAYLGATVWEKTENIDKLSTEYWNLRKLTQERDAVTAKLTKCQEQLRLAHEERANLLNVATEPELKLTAERNEILARINTLTARRDEIIASAKEIRRSYDGLKVKLEVIAGDTSTPRSSMDEQDKINLSLGDLKFRFVELKNERVEIGAKIERGDAEIDRISSKIQTLKKTQYDRASKAFQIIGDVNKEISGLRAELGVLETRMNQLYAEIGRYVSRNTRLDSACSQAAAGMNGLINVMGALRRSIGWNHKLADR